MATDEQKLKLLRGLYELMVSETSNKKDFTTYDVIEIIDGIKALLLGEALMGVEEPMRGILKSQVEDYLKSQNQIILHNIDEYIKIVK